MRNLSMVVCCLAVTPVALQGQEAQPVWTVGCVKEKRIAAKAGTRTRTMIEVASVARDECDLRRTALVRTAGETLLMLCVDVRKILMTGDTSYNVTIQAGDIVFIPAKSVFRRAPPTLSEVLGEVFAAKLPDEVTRRIWTQLAARVSTAAPAQAKLETRLIFVEHHPNEGTRIAHLHAIGAMGEDAAGAVQRLMRILRGGGRLAAEVVTVLGMLGPVARRAVPTLEKLAKGADASLAKRINTALKLIGPGAAAAPARELSPVELKAAKARDAASLRWHYQAITTYKIRYRAYPSAPGLRFVFAPWVKCVVPHTTSTRDRFFSYAFATEDAHYRRLAKRNPATIWKSLDAISVEDTHFFGPSKANIKRISAKVALMASPVYSDGSINILYWNGVVREVQLSEKVQKTWTHAKLGLEK